MPKLTQELHIQKQNIGNAGEYYFASRLSAENFVVTITLGRTEKYDVLAVNPKGRTLKLSVKSRLKENVKSFPLSEKDEKGGMRDFFYALIKLNEFKKEPDFWVIPSDTVAKLIRRAHKKWSGLKNRKKTSIRKVPILLTRGDKKVYPLTWEKELRKFYKNIKILDH